MDAIPDYVLIWAIYLLGVSVGLVIFWRMTRFIHWLWFKEMLRAGTAALLLVPAKVMEDGVHLAPAFIVVAFDVLAEGLGGVPRGGAPLLWVMVGLFVLISVLNIVPRLAGK